MNVFRFPHPMKWALSGTSMFWLGNVWALYALNAAQIAVPSYFGSRYLACAVAAAPAALFGNFTGRGFATLVALPCLAVFNGYFLWTANGSLELWPPLAVADLLGFLPALAIFCVIKKRSGTRYLWY